MTKNDQMTKQCHDIFICDAMAYQAGRIDAYGTIFDSSEANETHCRVLLDCTDPSERLKLSSVMEHKVC